MFLTALNFVRHKATKDSFIRKQTILKLAANYYGRKRNCYSLAVRNVHRALVYATQGRMEKKTQQRELWIDRLRAGTEELGTDYATLTFGLIKSDVLINKKTLSDLAIWEPRTFKSLTLLAQMKEHIDPVSNRVDVVSAPEGVITRGML